MSDFTTWRSLVDGEEISAIPDSGMLHAHYDFSVEDGSLPVEDQTDNGYDLDQGEYSGVGDDINGVQAGVFDGTDDYVQGSSDTLSEPNSIYFVTEAGSQSADNYPFDGASIGNVNSHNFRVQSGDNIDMQNDIQGGDITNSPSIITGIFDSGDSILRQDGQEVASGSISSEDIEDITIGGPGDVASRDDLYYDGKIGEFLIYEDDDRDRINDVESYLSAKWGISI